MARMRVLAGVAAIAMLLAACGDSGSDDTADGAGDGIQIAVGATDFDFSPDAYLADAGAEVTVTLSNEGTVEHNWVLLETPIESEDDLESVNVLAEATAQPGATGTIAFTAPPAGDYQVVCDVPGHFAAGMVADFTSTG